MEQQGEQLWQGGSWEAGNPPVRSWRQEIAEARMRRKKKRTWHILRSVAILLLITLGITIVVLVAKAWLSGVNPMEKWGPEIPGHQDEQDWEYRDVMSDMEEPTIPRAATGTGVTVDLSEAAGQILTYQEIYEKTTNSVVSIEVKASDGYSTGSGIILTEDGYIVTNAHVVAGGEAVQVIFRNNHRLEASLVGFEPQEDLAVLKVEVSGLVPARFGDSDLLQVGDPVAALGDPLGYRATITDGIVSALDREVEVDDSTMTLIQTSTPINFGNSGGALLNQYGQVVGITTIKIISDDGTTEALGFAIPSQRVKFVVDRLIAGEEIRDAVIGIKVDTRPVPDGGILILAVTPGSDAAAQGIQPGDIILAVNGRAVRTLEDLNRGRINRDVGDTITLTILRSGERLDIAVQLIPAEES